MCGIFGYCAQSWNPDLMSFHLLQGHNLQHRGQENAGFVFSNGREFDHFKGSGLVSQVFYESRKRDFIKLEPTIAIAHTRYATAGSTDPINAQPHWVELLDGFFALANNGHEPMIGKEIVGLKDQNIIIKSSNESEVFLKNILIAAQEKGDLVGGIKHFMEHTEGAYSTCLMTLDKLYLFRDPWGFRPLYFGKWQDTFIFASETCAFHERDAQIEREVRPGELIVVDTTGKREEYQLVKPKKLRQQCIFEFIYFARPDSYIFGCQESEVGSFRYSLGKQLAVEWPIGDAAVVSVPDSGNFAAIGFAHQAGLPFRMLFVRSQYIPRTFQISGQIAREHLVRLKYSVMPSLLKKRKRIVIVDDSIVRLTSMKIIVQMIREAAMEAGINPNDIEIHIRISSPRIIAPCFYGIDTPSYQELIAANHTDEKIAQMINVDSVRYVSLAGLDKVAKEYGGAENFCHACFTDKYPTEVPVKDEAGC